MTPQVRNGAAIPLRRVLVACFLTTWVAAAEPRLSARVWEPVDVELHAATAHPWWTFPVRATFTHARSQERIDVDGFWDGEQRWIVRFCAPRPGTWDYRTTSADGGLNGHRGRIEARAPTAAERADNPNLRGAIRVAASGRYFEYADGTPFFLLADTVWAANTARCGLGANKDGPFFEVLADRKAKGFTALLMQLFHGYGDYPDSPGHRNEGGHTFFARDPARLNPAHFAALDQRMQALWERGWIAAVNTTWWGKTRQCIFKPEDAARIAAYCAVRYGAFNALWSVAGEYQYVFNDCGWTPADISRLGETMQGHNPWRRPLSVHPSARLEWPAPHNVQSSRPFHAEPWLDHHWLQTGQSADRLFNIVTRLRDDRALQPAKPAFLSEAAYESVSDADAPYHVRWQVWASFLNGAAGYGYGAYGMWQFYDPADPTGEKGKAAKGVVPWREALRAPGSSELAPAKALLTTLEWWKLEPQRDRVRVDGGRNPLPTATDLTPPHLAAVGEDVTLVYLPRGNRRRLLELPFTQGAKRSARWFDPRAGRFHDERVVVPATDVWRLPDRPAPQDEDWVLVITKL